MNHHMNEDRPLFMNDAAAMRRANQLINWGYRKTSNRHRMISRIDRPDWYRYMAQKHAPWDPNGEGIHWVFSMGNGAAEDHYRRCYSEDTMTVSDSVIKFIPTSNHESTGYCRKKDEPKSYDVCKGDIEVSSTKNIRTAENLHGMYKIHSMNVITGRSVSTNNAFHDDLDSAMAKCKSIVARDPDIRMVILRCTHVVQAAKHPIEVVDLDE